MGEKCYSLLPVSCMTESHFSISQYRKGVIPKVFKETEIPFKLTFVHPHLIKGNKAGVKQTKDTCGFFLSQPSLQ